MPKLAVAMQPEPPDAASTSTLRLLPSAGGTVRPAQADAAAAAAQAALANKELSQADLPQAEPPMRNGVRDLLLYGLIATLVLGAWGLTQLDLYDRQSDTAYWLGFAGGMGMLLLLSYPMRKHLRFMRRAGPAGHWFFGHMVLGVGSPLLILLHSRFEIGSLNAGVAFYSMILVACSGVVGRFLYLRVHRSLHGEKQSLEQLREQLAIDNDAATRLRFAPGVIERCRRFERFALEQRMASGAEVIRAMVVVPWVRWSTEWACRAELRRRLVAVAHTRHWSRRRLRGQLRRVHRLAGSYLAAAQRVAMFAAWDRVFSWWHIAHVPFVWILIISAVVHVVAVHAY